MAKILVVEDRESLRTMLERTLREEGFLVEAVGDGHAAARKLRTTRYLMMLTDLRLPGPSGIELLKMALDNDPHLPVVVMTAYGSVKDAVDAMRLGAFDFIEKPFDMDLLVLLVQRAASQRRLWYENLVLREEFREKLSVPEIVGERTTLKKVTEAVGRAAPTDVTVLLSGESGTGKEVFARAIHGLSSRSDAPFIAINCAAIPDNLLENELFGHEKGSFTGATGRQLGKFDYAHEGTMLLDEIGDLSPPLQAKILRVMQDRTFHRVGGNVEVSVDVRVIAATNKDLAKEVEEGRFRKDLYYRLNVFPIEIPPLRERRADVPILANHFLVRFSRELGKEERRLDEGAVHALLEYAWPGNVRELENCMERAMILCDQPVIRVEHLHLPGLEKEDPAAMLGNLVSMEGSLPEVLERVRALVERAKIRSVMLQVGSDRRLAAQALEISVRTLTQRLKALDLMQSQEAAEKEAT